MSQARREMPRASDPESTSALTDAMAGSMQTMFKAMTELQQQYLQFATQRLEKSAVATSEFLRCKSWDDVTTLQQSWAKQVTDEYAQHFAKLTEMTQSALQNAAATAAESSAKHS